ncbi:MAG: hypothetical protein EYC70_15480 [Planctomycetota bacterium]|nr:MAG: hypothetical protein EYC70_15480 [Planctomycetota bacterium]
MANTENRTEVEFTAPEYHADGSFRVARFRFEGTMERGWSVLRDGRPQLQLGPGYRLLRVKECGICSTDIARAFLPFPLPQTTGHEVLAVDEEGQRYVVEINASHQARGVASDCPFCAAGLPTHCPERTVLGIDRLPGGFGPWVLAPVHAAIPVPDSIPDRTAVLTEPLAAALHAVQTVAPKPGDRIAVLGPRRLGMLVVAAAAAWRERHQRPFTLIAIARHRELLEMAGALGADEAVLAEGDGAALPDGLAEVVIDTTGNPQGLELAVRLAKREVHLKSTHGRPAVGLRHLTELVVDEVGIGRLEADALARFRGKPVVAWLARGAPPKWLAEKAQVLRGSSAAELLAQVEKKPLGTLPRADVAVVDRTEQVDEVLRPVEGRQVALVRPRGEILVTEAGGGAPSVLLEAIRSRGLRLTSSRCGDFHAALDLLVHVPGMDRLGERMVSHHFDAGKMNEAFVTAKSPECIKAVVEQAEGEAQPATRFQTTLGPACELHAGTWTLDLTELPLFHGLSVLSRALGDLVVDQADADRVDISVERPVHPRENPELLHHLGVSLVKVVAEHEVLGSIAASPELFQDHLRVLFGTLQRAQYRNALFAAEPAALVFDFTLPAPAGPLDTRFVLERVVSSKEQRRCFLRITIEDPRGRRLDLSSVRHVPVADLGARTFIAGSTRIAQTWRDGARREAERGRRAFVESRKAHSHLFTQFGKAGLGGIERAVISWSDDFVPMLVEGDPAELDHLFKRVLLALEDRGIRELLDGRAVVRVVVRDVSVYLDLAQLGRELNISLGRRRERLDVEAFLERMPALSRVVAAAGTRPLAGVKLFLVHHITAEVLGLVAALRRLGCRDLETLFVSYAGETPGSYLGPLLDLPAAEFRSLSLSNVPDAESVEGHYRLSTQFSSLANEKELAQALRRRRGRFYEAMQAAGLVEFLRLVARAEKEGTRVLLIEDGGYLAPALNRACLEGRTVRELMAPVDPDWADVRLLRDVLDRVLLGTVEHTRNGFNRLDEVERALGRLAYPAFSIAVSRHKTQAESREVALSILNAVENVLSGAGGILSRRNCVVLGSRGSIGSFLMRDLRGRLLDSAAQLSGVDLRVDAPAPAETRAWRDLPLDRRRALDMIFGVVGKSLLEGVDLEDWLLHGERPRLILASGSTKTEEFSALAEWIDRLLRAPAPEIQGRRVQIAVTDVYDAVTGRVYGQRFQFTLPDRQREVVLIAGGRPVNFLFYGVATEMIDEVLAQLTSAALGLVRRAASGEKVPPRLLAVDRDIDADGRPLAP